MKIKQLFCVALLLSLALTGCVIHREFRGSTSNLKGDGGQTPPGEFLKMKLANSGITANGGNYITLSLPSQNCELTIFYPKLRPYSYQVFQAQISTNHTHVWQIHYLTNDFHTIWHTNLDLPEKQMAVWIVRGEPLSSSQLKCNDKLPQNARRLYGQIEMTDTGREFQINVELSNDDGTHLSGIFDSYEEFWGPLAYTIALFVGPD